MNHVLAVDHLTDWNLIEWWLHYLGAIAVPVLAAAFVAAAYLMCRAILLLTLPNLLEAALAATLTAFAFAGAFLGLNWHIELLYDTLRHTSSATRAAVSGLTVAILFAATSVIFANNLGITRRRRLAVIALACAAPAAFSLVGDGLNRSGLSTAHDTSSVGMQSPTAQAAQSEENHPGLAPKEVLPRSPPLGQPGP